MPIYVAGNEQQPIYLKPNARYSLDKLINLPCCGDVESVCELAYNEEISWGGGGVELAFLRIKVINYKVISDKYI